MSTDGGPREGSAAGVTLDDWEKYAFWPGVTGTGTIERPSLVAEHWWEEVLAYAEEGACCVITMHPFLSGRRLGPGRLAG